MEFGELLIIGPPRSGTTLIAYLLGGGEGVLCLSEPYLIYALAPHWRLSRFYYRFQKSAGLARRRPPREGDHERYRHFLRRLAQNNGFRFLAIKETFRDGRLGPRWRDVKLLDELVARSQPLVALIRHPYDVAVSTIKLCRWVVGVRGWLLRCRWPVLPHFRSQTAVVRWAADNWVRYCAWARGHGLELLRYEDFVGAPERHLRDICQRACLPFDQRMLDHRQPRVAFGGIGDPWLTHGAPRAVSRQSVGQAHKLTVVQREIVQSACAAAAAELGYAL